MDVRYRTYLQIEIVKFVLDPYSFVFHLLILIPLLLTYSTMHRDSGVSCGVFHFCQDTNWLFEMSLTLISLSHICGQGNFKTFLPLLYGFHTNFPKPFRQIPEHLTVKTATIDIIQMPPLFFYLYQDCIAMMHKLFSVHTNRIK